MTDQCRNISIWLRLAGITWDKSLVDLRPVDGGLGVFAVRHLCDGQKLCEIPKKAVLSVQNTGIAELLEEHKIGGGLGLIIAIMYELSIGKKSFWHGYLSALEQQEHLPLFWAEEERSLLQGTEVEHRPQEDEELTQEDFETNVRPLVEHADRLKPDAFTLDTFRTAASWVASRAFGVDSFHGMSMVPLADIFNHKAAIVQLSDEYIIEPTCYEQDDSSEDDNSLASEASGDEEDLCSVEENGHGDSVTGPGENSPPPAVTRGSMLRLSGGSIDQYRLEIGICGATNSNGEEVLEIIAASPVPKGQEVHNTYGELGNAELVVKYGFALRRNPFDVVLLDKGELVEEARHIVGDRACRQRCRFLSRDSELLEEDREPFEVLPDGCIGPSLLVALRVLLAADSEFHSWRSLDDALKLCASKPQPEGASDRQQESDSGCKAAEQPETAEQPDMHHHCGNGHSLKGSRKRGSGEDAGCGSEPISEGAGLKKQCSEGAREADNACRDGIAAVCGQADVNGALQNGNCRTEGTGTDAEAEQAQSEAEEQPMQISNTSIRTARICGTLTGTMCTALTRCIQLRLQRYRHEGLAEDLRELEAEEGRSQQKEGRSDSSRARLAALRLVVAEKELLHAALEALR